MPPITITEIKQYLASDMADELLEAFVSSRETLASSKDIVIVHGLVLSLEQPYAAELNFKIATALDAYIIFVLAEEPCQLSAKIMVAPYLKSRPAKLLGYIFDKVQLERQQSQIEGLKLLGKIPYFSNPTDAANSKLISQYLDVSWLEDHGQQTRTPKISAALFRYRLIESARKLQKRIILPEGDEPRTLQAANICATQGIAKCVLLAEKNAVLRTAAQLGITLHNDITIIEPQTVAEKYIDCLYELRKHKGLTRGAARQQLADNVVVGTMMLHAGEVDGLVSGAVHTTANTIKPAFQLIKTTPDTKIISSVFFMCLPEQVLVYGDCAVNPNPTAEELADIAIQSADSAFKFGITPHIALLSYSTGTSGTGAEVEKVKKAVEIAQQKRPDLTIDGPLQYDAAISPDVAALKAPQSFVAGKANVFISPNLDAGNIAYKAVQRSADIICVGPVLQGMRKPVNDLSRGCLVKDIVFTIALTAVQAV